MIEVKGEILRGACIPVFFFGEILECEIKFSYKCLKAIKNLTMNDKQSYNHIEKFKKDVNILFACAQINYNCYIDDTKILLPKDPLSYMDISTISQLKKHKFGFSIFSSRPKVLFWNLSLGPNETKSCKTSNSV
jgi:hypothetical protein